MTASRMGLRTCLDAHRDVADGRDGAASIDDAAAPHLNSLRIYTNAAFAFEIGLAVSTGRSSAGMTFANTRSKLDDHLQRPSFFLMTLQSMRIPIPPAGSRISMTCVSADDMNVDVDVSLTLSLFEKLSLDIPGFRVCATSHLAALIDARGRWLVRRRADRCMPYRCGGIAFRAWRHAG